MPTPPAPFPFGARLIILLALGASLMSAAFLLHSRHVPVSAGHLPGLTLGATGPGLVVTSVETGGDAARHGVAVGDAVLTIDGQAFRALDQAEAYLIRSPRDQVVLRLREDGRTRQVVLDRAEE